MGNVLRVYNYLLSLRRREEGKSQVEFRSKAFRAAGAGDVGALLELMEVPGSMGALPLMTLADPRSADTLLHAAMERAGADCVRFLIGVGCEVTRGNQSQETPLHVACMNDNLDGLEGALAAGAVDLEVKDRWQRTLLLKALIYHGHRVFHRLLGLGADLNTQDVHGLSLMHVAVSYDRRDLVRDLAARGASLDLLNEQFRSPLALAVSALNTEMVRELLLLGASTHHPKAAELVVMVIGDFVRRSERRAVCDKSEEILHLMLAAHGLPIHSDEPGVFQRVLVTTDVDRFLPLLHKMYVCSDCPYDDLHARVTSLRQARRSHSLTTRTPVSLFDLSRRAARSGLMRGGGNVLWAVDRLPSSVPPAVRGLLLLKDCDRKHFVA